jgi:hypothetical protein
MKRPRIIMACLIALATFGNSAHAREYGAFQPWNCTWHASHVVLADFQSEGRLSVVESWKGDLEKGDAIHLPGFAAPGQWLLFLRDQPFNEQQRKYAIGKWFAVFPGHKAFGPGGGPAEVGDMRFSVAWIKDAKVHANIHTSRGPAKPAEFHEDAKAFKQEVLATNAEQRKLTRAKQISDTGKRAVELLVLTSSHSDDARRESFLAIRGCGDAGVKVLCQILDDSLMFYRENPPTNAAADVTKAMRRQQWIRHSNVDETLRSMEALGAPECEDVVRHFRDYWTSLSGLNPVQKELSDSCDRILDKLSR